MLESCVQKTKLLKTLGYRAEIFIPNAPTKTRSVLTLPVEYLQVGGRYHQMRYYTHRNQGNNLAVRKMEWNALVYCNVFYSRRSL